MAADWRDIVRRSGAGPAASGAANPAFDAAVAPAPDPAATPAIARLLAERAALEARMAALTGDDDAVSRARYPVAPMAERRAELQRWETQRSDRIAAARDRRPAFATAAPDAPARPAAPPEPPAAGTPVDPRRWYARRDAAVASPTTRRSAGTAERPAAPPERPKPAAAEVAERRRKPAEPPPRPARPTDVTPVRPVARVKPRARPEARARPGARAQAEKRAETRPQSDKPAERRPAADTPLARRDARRAAAPTPAAPKPAAPREPARPFGSDLRRAITETLDRSVAKKAVEKIGADRLAKPKARIAQPLARARAALDGANRASRVLSDAWDKRRDLIAGADPDRYARGYDDRKARLFGVETGSLNDLAERTERQRQAGIARRADARASETADADRRARAQASRSAARQEERKREQTREKARG